MLKLVLPTRLRAFLLLFVVVLGIVMRLMIGYSAFSNPLHVAAGSSFQNANSELFELVERNTKLFKLKRKVALEVMNHFPFSVSSPLIPSQIFISIVLNSKSELAPTSVLSPHYRPPTKA